MKVRDIKTGYTGCLYTSKAREKNKGSPHVIHIRELIKAHMMLELKTRQQCMK